MNEWMKKKHSTTILFNWIEESNLNRKKGHGRWFVTVRWNRLYFKWNSLCFIRLEKKSHIPISSWLSWIRGNVKHIASHQHQSKIRGELSYHLKRKTLVYEIKLCGYKTNTWTTVSNHNSVECCTFSLREKQSDTKYVRPHTVSSSTVQFM